MKNLKYILSGKVILFLLLPFVLLLVVTGACHYVVVQNAKGLLYSAVEDIPESPCGLLLGTTPQRRWGEGINPFFEHRVDAAAKLYKAGKIRFILVSGDAHSLNGVDETRCMKDSLVRRGVPAEHIFLDGKGFRTLDSVVRLCKVYGVKDFTVISQRFHNERALYLAEHLNLDLGRVQGFNAADPESKTAVITYVREYLARVKVFLDLFTGKQPQVMDSPSFLKDE